MTSAEFAKRYPNQQRATRAIAHRDWLSGLECGVRLPALRSATARELVFEHLGTRHPDADDLVDLAQALGRLRTPPPTSDTCTTPDWTSHSTPGTA